MTYQIAHARPLPEEIVRIGRNRLGRAIAAVDAALGANGDPTRSAELAAAIFVMRRRCKQVRALVALVDTGQAEMLAVQRHVRAAARAGACIRDTEAMVAARGRVEALVGPIEIEIPLVSPGDQREALERARRRLVKADRHMPDWVVGNEFETLLPGLRQTYRQGRQLLTQLAALPTGGIAQVELAHDWRREVKVLRYQLRLLAELAPSYLAPILEDLNRINVLLGADHDLWLVSQHLVDGGQIKIMDRHHASLQSESITAGAFVYAESPRAFTKRIGRYATAARFALLDEG